MVNVQAGLVHTFVDVCGGGSGEITYEDFVKLLWQDETVVTVLMCVCAHMSRNELNRLA